jgi:hypothetical protein
MAFGICRSSVVLHIIIVRTVMKTSKDMMHVLGTYRYEDVESYERVCRPADGVEQADQGQRKGHVLHALAL